MLLDRIIFSMYVLVGGSVSILFPLVTSISETHPFGSNQMHSVHPGLFSHECNAKMLDQYLFMIHATVKPVALYLHCVRKSNLITTFSNPGVGRLEIYAMQLTIFAILGDGMPTSCAHILRCKCIFQGGTMPEHLYTHFPVEVWC